MTRHWTTAERDLVRTMGAAFAPDATAALAEALFGWLP